MSEETTNPKLEALRARDGAVTAEEWAEALGFMPQYSTPEPPKDKPKKVMRRVYNPKFELWAATKAFHGWPEGKELDEEAFLEAVADATDPKRGKNIFR